MTQLPIDTELPLARPGEPAPAFEPQILNLAFRKLNALWNLRGVGNVKINKTEDSVTVELAQE